MINSNIVCIFESMKSLVIGGGGTKIVGQYPIALEVYNTIKPEIIDGTSAGAIIALLLPCIKDSSQVTRELLELKPSDFWAVNPVSDSGNISLLGIFRALTSAESLGDMSNLKCYLKSFITKKDFDNGIRFNDKLIAVNVSTVCFNTGHRAHVNLKSCEYAEAIDWVIASASIPVFAKSLKYYDSYYYDGGVRSHIGGPWILETYGKQITEMVSVYSRPEDYNIMDRNWKPNNVLDVLERTIEIMNMEISKRDQDLEIAESAKLGVKLTQLFLPKVLTSTYDTNPQRLSELYYKGLEIARTWKLNNTKK